MTTLNDGLTSANNDLGKRSQARTYTKNQKLSDTLLTTLYEDNWIVRKFIDAKTSDMTRIDREIKNDLPPEHDKKIESFCKQFGIFSIIEDCLRWGRLYGDAIILAVTESLTAEEVNLEGILDLDRERITKFIVLDKQMYSPSKVVVNDITSPLFGEPVYYTIKNDDNIKVNTSRVYRLSAGRKPMSKKVRGGTQSYGSSEVSPVWNPLIAYDTAKTGISDLIEEAKVDVVKIKDYNQKIAEGQEERFIELGISMKTVKSLANILMIDQDADWQSKELSSMWINEALKESRTDIAGACEMPLTRLFGQSAAGFASGEEDNKIYYEHINAKQESMLRPMWAFIDKFMIDYIKEKDETFTHSFFDYDFPTIRDRDEKQQAEIFQIVTNALVALYGTEAIDPITIAEHIKLKGFINISDEQLEKLKAVVNDPTWQPAAQSQGGFGF